MPKHVDCFSKLLVTVRIDEFIASLWMYLGTTGSLLVSDSVCVVSVVSECFSKIKLNTHLYDPTSNVASVMRDQVLKAAGVNITILLDVVRVVRFFRTLQVEDAVKLYRNTTNTNPALLRKSLCTYLRPKITTSLQTAVRSATAVG